MEEIKLVCQLIWSLLIQFLLLPFKLVSFAFEFVEKVARICKETVNNLIKSIKNEVLK